ncbi:hypothetical protein K438DRAFT_1773718 [Mycena galopus ATCC 62051]|nr:hypothetical protein K438DRAFT_1773718 [Mycena galopus ATCC 62051]
MYRQVVSTMGSQTAEHQISWYEGLVGLPSEDQESLPNSSITIQLHLDEPDRWLGKGSTGRDGLPLTASIRPVKTGMVYTVWMLNAQSRRNWAESKQNKTRTPFRLISARAVGGA